MGDASLSLFPRVLVSGVVGAGRALAGAARCDQVSGDQVIGAEVVAGAEALAGVGSPLGTIAKYSSTSWRTNVGVRFDMQRAARDLVVQGFEAGVFDQVQRVAFCMWSRIADQVRVIQHPDQGTASYAGLATCGSVWMCPVCAAKVSERRRQELAGGLATWEAGGGLVLMATYTIRHKAGDDLPALLDGLAAARASMTSGRWSQEHKARWGLAGSVRALEVTHGVNGWHVHMHELCLMDRPVAWDDMTATTMLDGRLVSYQDLYVKEFRDELYYRWAASVAAAGLRDVNEHAVKVDTRSASIAEYVTKLGSERTWTIEHELTKAVSKVARHDESRSPIALLADYMGGDLPAGRLWLDYARAFKGKRQLVWSKGLRSRLGLTGELSDEELAAQREAFGVDLLALAGADWDRLRLFEGARADVLRLAADNDYAGLVAYLEALGVFVNEVSPADDQVTAEIVLAAVLAADSMAPQVAWLAGEIQSTPWMFLAPELQPLQE